MEYTEAGKFIKKKRKSVGYATQKSFIQALLDADPDINCSESYISLIESGAKSPSVHLLDLMSTVLNLSPHEKGELLLIYKRVPNDLEFAVRSNLKASLQVTNLDTLKSKYENDKNKQNFNNLVRALVLEGKSDEAIELLKTAPNFSSDFIDFQDRTAKMAAISGNYDFAIQAFNLALESCSDEFLSTKADILMNIGVCYFNKGLQLQDDKPFDSLELLAQSKNYLEQSIALWPDYIYCLDEYARCIYHIADVLLYFYKNKTVIKIDPKNQPNLAKWLKAVLKNDRVNHDNDFIISSTEEYFKKALSTYRQILSHSERGDLPEKALKEAIYFHAYTHCKLKLFDDALLLINTINILDHNWLTYFLKTGYYVMKYENEKNEDCLNAAVKNISIAMEYEPETVKILIKTEKNRELKTLWELKGKELDELLQQEEKVNA
jgi:tetratricopeptide (TPR) repeat protein